MTTDCRGCESEEGRCIDGACAVCCYCGRQLRASGRTDAIGTMTFRRLSEPRSTSTAMATTQPEAVATAFDDATDDDGWIAWPRGLVE